MDDALPVGIVHRPSQDFQQSGGESRRHWRAGKPSAETGPRDEFHHEIGLAFDLTCLVDVDDVWMLKPRDRLGFPAKASNGVLRRRGPRWESS